MFVEMVLITVLLAGLCYFLLDSMKLFNWLAGWGVVITMLIFFGFIIAIGIHFANVTFGW